APIAPRRWPSRHQTVARGARELRHAADRGKLVSLYRVLSQARAGESRADRSRSEADRTALSHRRRPGRRHRARFAGAAAAAHLSGLAAARAFKSASTPPWCPAPAPTTLL